MSRMLQALALAAIIPALALGAIWASNERLESDWRALVIGEVGPQSDAALDRTRLGRICDDPEIAGQMTEACLLSGMAETFVPLGVAALVLSLVTLASLVPLRVLARRDRKILAHFRPALLALLLALFVIVLLDGALVAAAAYMVESAFTGGVHPIVVFGIGVAVFVAATGVLRAAITMGRLKPLPVKGLVLDRERDGRLFDAVDDIALRVGVAAPDNIIAGLDPTFFVTEAPVKAFDGVHQGRTLFLSVPFLRILSRPEFVAVVGHELGHFRGEDTLYSRRFYPVYRGSIEALGVLQASSRGVFGIPLLPPLRMLELFFLSFAEAERGLSRQRELAADAVGAEAASAEDLGVALVKLDGYAGIWRDAYVEAIQAVRERRGTPNLALQFARMSGLAARRSLLADVDHGRISHPTDSHPRTAERLAALGTEIDGCVDRAMDVRPADGAFDLIDNGDALEADLMEDFGRELADPNASSDEPDAPDLSDTLRTAARTDRAIATLVELEEEIRGPALRPWLRATEDWVTLADLDVRPHPEPRGFDTALDVEDLPAGDQWLVVGVASPRTAPRYRVPAGERVRLIGISVPAARQAGHTEVMFDAGGRILTARLVGDWPVDHQIGGMFVVPVSDPLVGVDSAFRDRLASVVEGLVQRDRS